MGKNPAFQFYPDAYQRDTRPLSRAARGDWTDILCALHFASSRGTLTLTVTGWANLIGCTVDEMCITLWELHHHHVAVIKSPSRVTFCNGKMPESDAVRDVKVTVMNRRMVAEEKAKQSHAKRQSRYRQKQDVTPQ